MYEENGTCSLHTIVLIDFQALYCLYDISHADGMIEDTMYSAINQYYFFGPQWVKHVPIVENCGGMEKNVRFLTVQLHTHVSINMGAHW